MSKGQVPEGMIKIKSIFVDNVAVEEIKSMSTFIQISHSHFGVRLNQHSLRTRTKRLKTLTTKLQHMISLAQSSIREMPRLNLRIVLNIPRE